MSVIQNQTKAELSIRDVSTEFNCESEVMLIAFGGISGALPMPVFEFFKITTEIPVKKMFLRDTKQAWYHRGIEGIGDNVEAIATWLKQEISQQNVKRVVMTGGSAGGYAALLFGHLLEVDQVITFGPQTYLDPSNRNLYKDKSYYTHIDVLYEFFDTNNISYPQSLDLKYLFENKPVKTTFQIHFCHNYKWDKLHGEYLENCPNVELYSYPEGGHGIAKWLRDNGKLKPILLNALGIALCQKGETEEAIASARKTIELAPEERKSSLYLQLTDLLLKKKIPEAAIASARKAIELASEKEKGSLYPKLTKLLFDNNLTEEAELVVEASIQHFSEQEITSKKILDDLPIISLLKALVKAIDSDNQSLQQKSITILASRSLAHKVLHSHLHIRNGKDIVDLMQPQVSKIVKLSSFLDEQKSLELFLFLSTLGCPEILEYYLNSFSHFFPKISISDFHFAYGMLTAYSWMPPLIKKLIEPAQILEVVEKSGSLDHEDSTSETAVIYSILCFIVGKQEDLSLLLKFVKDKRVYDLNNDTISQIGKNQINFSENLRTALISRLTTKTNTLCQHYPIITFSNHKNSLTEKELQSNKPKVALCISGQLRGYRKAWPSIKKCFVDKLNPDIFIHTWEDIGSKEPNPIHANRVFSGNFLKTYKEILNKNINYDEIKQYYPILFKELYDRGKVNLAFLKKFYGTDHVVIENDKDSKFAGWTNCSKMYYKIWKCSELMQSSANDYDLVIRLRPDCPLTPNPAVISDSESIDWYEIVNICNSEPVIYCDGKVTLCRQGVIVGDMLAFGSKKIMECYASAYPTETFFREQKLLGHGFFPHTDLGNRFWLNNIQVKKNPFSSAGLQNASLSNQEIQECLNIDVSQRQITKVDELLLQAINLDIENEQLSTVN